MHVGAKFRSRGRPFECVSTFEHFIPARCVTIFELESKCPDCDRTFTCNGTATKIRKGQFRRRCPDCYKPGVPVAVLKNTKRSSARKPKGKRKGRRRPIDAQSPGYGATSQLQTATGHKQGAQSVATAAGRVSTGQALPVAVASPEGVAAPSPTAIELAAVVDSYAAALGFLD
jgi:hypothetical protein